MINEMMAGGGAMMSGICGCGPRAHGLAVVVEEQPDLMALKRAHGVPPGFPVAEVAAMISARSRLSKLALAVAAALAVPIPSVAAQAPAEFAVHENPRPVPEVTFEDVDGRTLSLAHFRGKVVLLNIWATWCAPCRREMPTLDRLQAELGGPDFEVVALSIDRKGLPAVQAFYEEIGLETLPIYVDRSGSAQRSLRVLGIPTTLLLDPDGNEIGRLAGPAEWDSPDMVTFIRSYIEQRSGRALDPGRNHLQPASLHDRPAAPGRMHDLEAPFPSSDWKGLSIAWMRRTRDELTGNSQREKILVGPGLGQRASLLARRPEGRDRGRGARRGRGAGAELELAGRHRGRSPAAGLGAVRRHVRSRPVHEQDGRRVVPGLREHHRAHGRADAKRDWPYHSGRARQASVGLTSV